MAGASYALPARFVTALLASFTLAASAELKLPTNDQEVLERLPAAIFYSEAAPPRGADPAAAVALARRHLEMARRLGDARFAGLAMGALQGWDEPRNDPIEVLVMQATIAQHLHEFERAERLLGTAVARAPDNPQAWLTLATVRRVRGRLAASDTACRGLVSAGQPFYGDACLAENRALRGDTDGALAHFERLLARSTDQGQRAWLLASAALAHELAGDVAAAERQYRSAVTLSQDGFTRLAYADLLLANARPSEADAVLADAPASDAVLLRRAIAARALGKSDAAALAAEIDQRFATASARGNGTTHLRERAIQLLALRDDAAGALELAERNLAGQREPADLLLFARAASAAGDAAALRRLRALMNETGIRDERTGSLL